MNDKELLDMMGARSVEDGGVLFCGVSEEEFAINGVTHKWPTGAHLTWCLNFSKLGTLGDGDLKGAYVDCFKEIANACDLTFAYTTNPRTANLLVHSVRLDGPSGILADCQIPVGNVRPGPDGHQLTMRIDDSEVWGLFDNPPAGKIDFYRVALHELLHYCGLGHKPANIAAPALIAPMYNPRMRHLQAADIAELVRRYGKAKVVISDPTVPPATPPAGATSINLTIGGPAPSTAPAGAVGVDLGFMLGGRKYRTKGHANPV